MIVLSAYDCSLRAFVVLSYYYYLKVFVFKHVWSVFKVIGSAAEFWDVVFAGSARFSGKRTCCCWTHCNILCLCDLHQYLCLIGTIPCGHSQYFPGKDLAIHANWYFGLVYKHSNTLTVNFPRMVGGSWWVYPIQEVRQNRYNVRTPNLEAAKALRSAAIVAKFTAAIQLSVKRI